MTVGRPFVVVGGSVAALVAADTAAATGVSVELFLPERGVGGGFLPLKVGERRLDLGSRLIELSYGEVPSDPPGLSAYRPGPHGHRPYLRLIDGFVRELAGEDLSEVVPPDASVGGHRVGDVVLAGDLTSVAAAFSEEVLAAMRVETAQAVEREGDAGVFAADRTAQRWSEDLSTVGRAHAGPTFHDLVLEPIAAKILRGGGSDVVAALHRKIWLPLFHPRTIWQAVRGQLEYRPARPMFTVAGGGMGALLDRLLEKVESRANVAIRHGGGLTSVAEPAGTEVQLRFADGSSRRCERPLIATGAEEACRAYGVDLDLDKVTASVTWVSAPEADALDRSSVVFSAEPWIDAFRISRNLADAPSGEVTWCCELRSDLTDPAEQDAAAMRSLLALGIVRPEANLSVVHHAVAPGFVAPTLPNRARHQVALAGLSSRAFPVLFAAGGVTFGADSFNEQVVQGLQAAEIHA